eukprot:TRINITY_DN6219_c0_g1_i1.p1 TRINITY_DN6219_c0_g1~~TRINITY_DN6219_c0_g1_i1.p1  ORF type:complete len:824 (-),score=312.45 TRINITY_DN6219_c0_g1_i1:78-2549(-)
MFKGGSKKDKKEEKDKSKRSKKEPETPDTPIVNVPPTNPTSPAPKSDKTPPNEPEKLKTSDPPKEVQPPVVEKKKEEDKKPVTPAPVKETPKPVEEKKVEKPKETKKQEKPVETKKKTEKQEDVPSGEGVETEISSLESARLDPSETATSYREPYNLIPSSVFLSYDKLQNFARDLNTQIPNPEIVIIGKKSHGKSSIVEAFFGETVTAVGTGGVTKRPLFINMTNNLANETPKCTLKRESNKEFDHDVEVKISDLPAELAKRNKVASDEPIVLQYEYKNCCNITFIDTPGLLEDDDGDSSKEDRDNLVLSLAKPSHRLIVCVEQSREWTRMEMINFVKKVDPELSRTTFVYTKFQTHLQNFTSTREVNKFLSGTLPDVKTFFVTVPSDAVRAKFSDPDQYRKKIFQAYRRDINGLEALQFDKRYESNIGVQALRKYILNLTWKSYQESIPRILKQLRARKVASKNKMEEVEKQLQSLDASKLRSIASNYVVNLLQIMERLISGTSEGNPAVNGQTLDEEKNAHGDGDWVDLYNRVIRFEPEEWKIPYWDNKLYGGQQFERLLAEYRAVAGHTEISEVTMDDVATAAGINKLNNIPNYSWAASDLAQQKSQEAFLPLIDQLTNRAIYILKRLTDIAEKVMDSRKKKWNEDITNSVEDIDRYPYFTYHVKDLFFKFVDNTAKICKEKCMDEFYSTRTIYWELTSENPEKNLPLERNDLDDTKTAVVTLATNIFNDSRDRITRNVLFKFYNFFLVPMQTELWSEIQSKVNCLSDSALEQIFEVSTTKEKLKHQINQLADELSRYAEQDKLFMDYAGSFSKRVEDH